MDLTEHLNLDEYRQLVVDTVDCPTVVCSASVGNKCVSIHGLPLVDYVHDARCWAFHLQYIGENVFGELVTAEPQKIININVRVKTRDDLDTISEWVKSL